MQSRGSGASGAEGAEGAEEGSEASERMRKGKARDDYAERLLWETRGSDFIPVCVRKVHAGLYAGL
jgi:hypothetical protein